MTQIPRQSWCWFDTATQRRVSITSAPTKELAEAVLRGWLARDAKGGRPDIHDIWPTVEVRLCSEVPEIGDPRPQPSDGPEYWSDLSAWLERNPTRKM